MKFMRQTTPQAVTVAKGQGRKELPSIYRTITEWETTVRAVVLSRLFVVSVVSFLLVVLIGWEGARLLVQGKELQYALENRETLMRQASEVEQVMGLNPGYRDGYFAQALLAYRLGDETKSREYLQKVFQIDPNFVPGEKLLGIMEKR